MYRVSAPGTTLNEANLAQSGTSLTPTSPAHPRTYYRTQDAGMSSDPRLSNVSTKANDTAIDAAASEEEVKPQPRAESPAAGKGKGKMIPLKSKAKAAAKSKAKKKEEKKEKEDDDDYTEFSGGAGLNDGRRASSRLSTKPETDLSEAGLAAKAEAEAQALADAEALAMMEAADSDSEPSSKTTKKRLKGTKATKAAAKKKGATSSAAAAGGAGAMRIPRRDSGARSPKDKKGTGESEVIPASVADPVSNLQDPLLDFDMTGFNWDDDVNGSGPNGTNGTGGGSAGAYSSGQGWSVDGLPDAVRDITEGLGALGWLNLPALEQVRVRDE